ncbi:MAG TPA: hypothetical protein DCR04_05915 [Flavobacteriales bacterium]|nr:hypothetical protein [Flavobacteriales bacterium]
MSQRYYDILGVNKDASLMEIKEAYERLCAEYEPSDHQFDPEYVKRYEEVQEAFDWLKNNHMWTINVEEENNDETVPPQQPDKEEKLIDLRYVLLAVVILSSAICYLFVSPYLGSGSSQTVVVSNHVVSEDLEELYKLIPAGMFTDINQFKETLDEEGLDEVYDLIPKGYFSDVNQFKEMFSSLIQQQLTNEQLLKDFLATAINDNYDWNLVRSKFPELEGVELQVLKDYAETAKKYNYDYSIINPKFPELFQPQGRNTAETKPSEENLSKFLVAFYAKHNVKLTKQKLSQIKSTYKDDVETLISDLLIKYENENPTKQRIQSIIDAYDLSDDGILAVSSSSANQRRDWFADESPNTTTALSHGGNPYGYCYTSGKSCSSRCSEIKVSANSRVGTIVIIKQKEEVVRCAYIDKGRTFTFKLPNGTYTPYFYSGTGWSNKKYVKTTTQCGRLYGGFTAGESVGKDTPQTLSNQILSYDLNTQFDGNFQTKSSDVSEAF